MSTSNSIVQFDGTPGQSAKVNYNVPLPGSHTGKRIIQLDLGLTSKDWLPHTKGSSGIDLEKLLDLVKGEDGKFIFNEDRALQYWLEQAKKAGVPNQDLSIVQQYANLSKTNNGQQGKTINKLQTSIELDSIDFVHKENSLTTENNVSLGRYEKFLESLKFGIIEVPTKTWGGGWTTTPIDPKQEPDPQLFIVEVYGISSFLGDYGLGRTVKTFTLLPGESTTISMKTWKSTSETIAEGSSIIDSHHKEASERFSQACKEETTDKATKSKTEKWHAEAEASASWGFGSAKVSGGGSGEYHSSREQFSHQLDETVREHASQASSAREMTVTSTSEVKVETGEETVVERVIKNVNMRRTLNFVFRELNQKYITKIHLKEVKIAYTNGKPGTWREVSLSGLRGLLEEVLAPKIVDSVAQKILKTVGTVFDYNDRPVSVLEKITMRPNGQSYSIAAAKMEKGEYLAPTHSVYYRFKRGPLAQKGEPHQVDGVVMKQRGIVMRTDSVLVEALLGEADALDNYAMEIQEAAAHAKTLENRREEIAHEILNSITDPVERAKAYTVMFNDQQEAKE